MENYLTQITGYLLTQSWQIAILVAVVAAVTLLLKNRSSHVRYLLWLIVLVKCLVPPLLTVPLAVLPEEQVSTLPAMLEDRIAVAFERPEMHMAEAPVSTAPSAAEPVTTVKKTLPHLSVRQWAGLGWIVGVTLFVLVAVTKALRTEFWLRRQRKLLSAKLQSEIENLFSGLEIRTLPKVWLVEGIGQPFVWGLLRGSIYLPVDFAKIDNTEHRRGVLGHELSHILRFDAAVNILQIIAQAVFWFHPFVWWANKRIRAEREKCCDEMAIARLDAQVKDYSRAIVETLVTEYESTRPVPSLAVAGPVKNIEERIKTMLRPGKKFYKRPSLPVAAVVILTALLSVPTSVVLTIRAENQPPTDSADADRIFGNPTNLGPTVNSSTGEWGPHISADGLSLYFVRDRPDGSGGEDIWITKRKSKDEPWSPPVNLGPLVHTSGWGAAPSLSADGLSFYFVSNRPGGSGHLDICVTKRKTKDGPWGTLANLGATVNSAATESGPSICADGLSLYFNSNRPGLGSSDIWVTKRKSKDDPWGAPVNLGPKINSPNSECAPSISSDGLSLYFHSNNRPGLGSSDIWVTKRKSKDDPWGTPVNLGPTVNSSYSESTPDISGDGSTLYFVSNRPGNVGGSNKMDIWQVSLTPQASSLQSAAFVGDLAKVQDFLDTGVDVNQKNTSGMTALQAAISGGHKELVELLLAKGADGNTSLMNGQTPLHWATHSSSAEVVGLLLGKGANVNAKGERDQTALHIASSNGHREIVELLLAHGADVNAGAYNNRTAAENAMRANHREIVELLISKGADISPLHFALYMKDQAKAKGLIESGADVNKRTPFGATPLHRAAADGFKDIAKLLIAKGADVNAKENWDWTPLHSAAENGHKDVLEMLIAKGADVHVRNQNGRTPLWYAKEQGHPEIVELLRKHGAKE